jgi:hypothetical protein
MNNSQKGIAVRLDSSVMWRAYEDEFDKVSGWTRSMSFILPFAPVTVQQGDRCWCVYEDRIMGWIEIDRIDKSRSRNGMKLPPLVFVSGPFHYVYPLSAVRFGAMTYIEKDIKEITNTGYGI